MPRYLYKNWTSQSTAAGQLERLNLHIEELTEQLGPEHAAGDMSRASKAIQEQINKLLDIRERLIPAAAIETGDIPGGGKLKAVFL